MNPQPSDMLPPQAVASMIRGGGTPGQIFQQNPLSQNMTPGAAGYDPSLAQQPAPGSQMQNPMTPPSSAPQAGMQQPNAGVPGQTPQPQMSEAEMILKALSDRLAHHSKVTQKTIDAITSQLDANQAIQNAPTA
jgi:hypothetical protein